MQLGVWTLFNPMGFRSHTSIFLNYVTIILCLNYLLCGNKETWNLKKPQLMLSKRHLVWMSKVTLQSLWFCIATLCDWLKSVALLYPLIRSETETNRDWLARVFPHSAPATCIFFLFWLVHWVVCVCVVIVRVMTLVLVLRHSIENRFMPQSFFNILTRTERNRTRCMFLNVFKNT